MGGWLHDQLGDTAMLSFSLDDELLDVNGVTITGMTIAEVGKVIQGCPNEFLATVRPITTLKRIRQGDVSRVNYVTVLPNLGFKLPVKASGESSTHKTLHAPTFVMKVTSEEPSSDDSLDDVGNYDDEEDLSGAERSPTPPSIHASSPETGESCPMSPSMPVETAATSPVHVPSSPFQAADTPSSPVQTLPGKPLLTK